MGRPSALTAERKKAVEKALASGAPLTVAAASADVSPRIVSRWLEEGHVVRRQLELALAPGVTAELSVNRDAVGLALAELKQAHGDLNGAIDVVEQLEPTTTRLFRSPSCTPKPNDGTTSSS